MWRVRESVLHREGLLRREMSKLQTAEGQCDKCYEPILWARNSVTGRKIPLDAKPTKDGQLRARRTIDALHKA